MSQTPTWAELVTLMTHGPDLPHHGRIRHVDPDGELSFGWAQEEDEPGPLVARGDDTGVTVWADGGRLRLEDSAGAVTLICDGETVWHFEGPGEVPREGRPGQVVFGWAGTDLLERDTDERWRGDDFTRPTGPVGSTTFLGRAAWTVELAPPRHKPHPMQLVIDAETGLRLRQGNEAFGTVSEWTELVVGEPLDPTLFTWDGAYVTYQEQRDEQRATRLAEERDNDDWVRDHLGVSEVRVELSAALRVWSHEPDGSFHGELEGVGHLTRGPRGASRAHETSPSAHTWSDESWDWELHAHEGRLAPGALERVQQQLGVRTHRTDDSRAPRRSEQHGPRRRPRPLPPRDRGRVHRAGRRHHRLGRPGTGRRLDGAGRRTAPGGVVPGVPASRGPASRSRADPRSTRIPWLRGTCRPTVSRRCSTTRPAPTWC